MMSIQEHMAYHVMTDTGSTQHFSSYCLCQAFFLSHASATEHLVYQTTGVHRIQALFLPFNCNVVYSEQLRHSGEFRGIKLLREYMGQYIKIHNPDRGFSRGNDGAKYGSASNQTREQVEGYQAQANLCSETLSARDDGRHDYVNSARQEQFNGYHAPAYNSPAPVPGPDRYDDDRGRNYRAPIIRSPVYSNRWAADTTENTRQVYASLPRSEPRMPSISSPRYSKSSGLGDDNGHHSTQKRDNVSPQVRSEAPGKQYLQDRESEYWPSRRNEVLTAAANTLSDEYCVVIGGDYNDRSIFDPPRSNGRCIPVAYTASDEADTIRYNSQSYRNKDSPIEQPQNSKCLTALNVDGRQAIKEPNGNYLTQLCSPASEPVDLHPADIIEVNTTFTSNSLSSDNVEAQRVLDSDPIIEDQLLSGGRLPENGSATPARKTAINPRYQPNSRLGGTKLIDVKDLNIQVPSPPLGKSGSASGSPAAKAKGRRGRPRKNALKM